MATLSNTTPGAQQLAPPQQRKLQMPQDPAKTVLSEVQYLGEKEQRDANLQVQWSAWMSDGQKSLSFYKHVFVLLLSWHPDYDDMSVRGEVSTT